jgi:hypothetical protein
VLVHVKGKGFKACSGVLHGGDAVATDGRSGHRGVRAGRHRGGASAVGRLLDDAWARAAAGGGARVLCRRSAAEAERSRGGSGGGRGRRSREVSGRLVYDFRKVQGPFCKLKFPIDTKS